jgi:pimeloyl-ACP methyl ester carboxylesterase
MTQLSGAPAVSLEDLLDGLRPFSRLEDREAGRIEEQRFINTPDGRLFVTLVEPLGPARGAAFLSCHSFAWEQFELYPLELAFARAAASAGFPTLTFQARGYNDSGGDFEEVSPSTHLRDALAAAAYLRDRTGSPVVPIGVRFGAAVALMAARELQAPGVALWNPSPEPGRYLDGLLRVFSVSSIMDEDGQAAEPTSHPGVSELKRALAAGETVDLFAYPMSAACYREAESTHPLEGSLHLPMRVLVVVVNPAKRREAGQTGDRLTGLGADVRVEEADGPGRGEFGLGIPRGGHLAMYLPTFEDIAQRTVRWAEEAW